MAEVKPSYDELLARVDQLDRQLQAFLDNTPALVYVKDLEGRFTLANRRVESLFSVPRERLLGKTLHELLPKEAADAHRANDLEALRRRAPVSAEEVNQGPDGPHTYLSVKFPLLDAAGEVAGVCGISTDITERRRSDEALRRANELFSLFVRNSPIHSFIKTVTPEESRVLHASENYKAMLGISGSDMVGKTMAELFPAELAAKMTADDWAVVATGEVLKLQEDFGGRHYSTIKFPIAQGDEKLLAGYTIDVTESRRAEEALRQSEERLRAVLDATPFPVALVDLQDDHIVYWSRSALATFGHTAPTTAEWYQMAYPEPAYRREVVDRWKPFLERARASRAPVNTGEYRVTCRDGSERTCELYATFLPDNLIVTFNDVTGRRRAEEEERTLERQLQEAGKLESVGRLAGGVAHDFNNMLGVILGHVELALEQVDPAQPLHADLGEIRAAALRSAELTRQLLTFARKQIIAPRTLDLNESVTGMLKMLHRTIGENIQLVWQPRADLWLVKMDPSQLDQILACLCVNARDAITDVGTVTIAAENCTVDPALQRAHADAVPGEYVRLAVSDDGCGMDEATLAHVFEPFFTTKGVSAGAGLGLPMVYGAVRQHGGFVTVESEPGAGTTFTVYLPRLRAASPTDRAQGTAATAHGGNETVLLVEDEPAILRVTTRTLERKGYRVLAASAPAEAVRMATEHVGPIHLLVTDVIMPGMNGRDLAQRVRALRPGLRCLYMSGYTSDIIADHGVLAEGMTFVQKPFNGLDLLAKVRAALDAASS